VGSVAVTFDSIVVAVVEWYIIVVVSVGGHLEASVGGGWGQHWR
jgi:hypothetical protein